MSEFAVEINNLTKLYGDFVALKDVTLRIPCGSVVGLIGPNGAGKSSLLKIISGLSYGDSGNGIVLGRDLASENIREHVGFMQENNPLPDNMRVGKYLRFRARVKGVPEKDVRIHVERVMRQCDLYYEARYKVIRTLSKGYKQRVGIADAMIGNKKLIVLDEPTIGLDPHQIIGVREVISEAKSDATMIISSHILHELESVCDYFVIINRGMIVAAGTIGDLRKQFTNDGFICLTIKHDFDYIANFCTNNSINIIDSMQRLYANEHTIKVAQQFTGENKQLFRLFLDEFGDDLIEIYKEQASLEDIFICATKRCRDE